MKLLCRVHPRGLSVKQQTKVYVRRTVHKESWKTIAPQIKNLEGQTPGWQVCRDTYQRMVDSDNTQDAYANCGRKAVITPDLRKWLIERLLVLRKKTVCTAEVLQRQLASKKRVVVEVSTVRHHLALAGYKWLPRGKKRKYTREQKIERKSFSDGLLAMTPSEMKKHFQFSMDGVVLTVPPTEEIARENFLHTDDLYVYQKKGERNLPELAGHDAYSKQVIVTIACVGMPIHDVMSVRENFMFMSRIEAGCGRMATNVQMTNEYVMAGHGPNWTSCN